MHNPLSPGDCVVMTAALECLHEQYPGQYATGVVSSCPAVFQHNPHVYDIPQSDRAESFRMHYPLIHANNQRPVHVLQGYVDYLGEVLGIGLKLTTNRPHLYLAGQEKEWLSQVQEITGRPTKFWVVVAGTKWDFTTKAWGQDKYQALVAAFRHKITFVQVGEAQHNHKPLRGAIDLIGKTDARQLIRLCWHAQGGLGPTTFLQHIFAAFEKPYVCLLGAREPVSWTHYPSQRTLSVQGALACCQAAACWRSRVVPLDDKQKELNDNLCAYPVIVGDDPRPRCMEMISVRAVQEAIESYYEGGVLSY